VRIYLGGPEADSLWDVRIHNLGVPGSQTYFGRDCAGIGDFNGDGIDDFAFSAQSVLQIGEVYVYLGWDGATDVEYEFEPTLPDDFTLQQNYPNPFNASTVIEFDLPERSRAVLDIFNVAGSRVVTLLDRELAAGTHRVTWDGRTSSGDVAASGVYIYRLATDQNVQSKKMMLLK
jgi:hypothetical protein